MWIIMNTGLLSVVDKSALQDHLVVRARVREHILAVFPDAKVRATPNADYQFRADIKRRDVAVAVARQIMEIDYDNFKDSIPESNLKNACSHVWSIMFKLAEPVHRVVGRGRGRNARQSSFIGTYWDRHL